MDINSLIPEQIFKKLDLKSDILNFEDKNIQLYKFGSGKNVILSFPAFPHSGLIYGNFLKHYKKTDITLITFDLPGWIGLSDNIFHDNIFEFKKILLIVEKIIEHYKLDSFSLIGFSFGTSIAVEIAKKYQHQTKKIALISPVLDGNIDSLIVRKGPVNIAIRLKLFPLIKIHILRRFKKYRKVFENEGLSKEFTDSYLSLIKKANPKIILHSLSYLFNTNFSEDIKILDSKKLLIASSHEEDKYLKDQSKHVRHILKYEKSLYVKGHHEDFILKPNAEVIDKIINFLKS